MKVIRTDEDMKAVAGKYMRVTAQCPICGQWKLAVWVRGWTVEAIAPCGHCGGEPTHFTLKRSSLL